MSDFDYGAPAELFSSKRTKSRYSQVAYKRFDAAALAIQYAIEELSPEQLAGAVLEVDEVRYAHVEIRHLYENDEYPLQRRVHERQGN